MAEYGILTDLYTFASSNDEKDGIVVGVTLCGPIHKHTEEVHDWNRDFYGAFCIDLTAFESLTNYFAPPFGLDDI